MVEERNDTLETKLAYIRGWKDAMSSTITTLQSMMGKLNDKEEAFLKEIKKNGESGKSDK